MGLFEKKTGTIFLKEGSDAEEFVKNWKHCVSFQRGLFVIKLISR